MCKNAEVTDVDAVVLAAVMVVPEKAGVFLLLIFVAITSVDGSLESLSSGDTGTELTVITCEDGPVELVVELIGGATVAAASVEFSTSNARDFAVDCIVLGEVLVVGVVGLVIVLLVYVVGIVRLLVAVWALNIVTGSVAWVATKPVEELLVISCLGLLDKVVVTGETVDLVLSGVLISVVAELTPPAIGDAFSLIALDIVAVDVVLIV